jgi:hypothetical protein
MQVIQGPLCREQLPFKHRSGRRGGRSYSDLVTVTLALSATFLSISGSKFISLPKTLTALAATGVSPELTGVGPKKMQKAGMLGQ